MDIPFDGPPLEQSADMDAKNGKYSEQSSVISRLYSDYAYEHSLTPYALLTTPPNKLTNVYLMNDDALYVPNLVPYGTDIPFVDLSQGTAPFGSLSTYNLLNVPCNADEGRIVGEVESIDESSEAKLLKENHEGPRRPMPSDWERWKPMINAKYKTATARMIAKDLTSEGFYVTETMLRRRLKEWGLDNKNKKPNKRLARPIPANPEDFTQRMLLDAMDRYLEVVCSSQLERYEGDRIADLLFTLDVSIRVAVDMGSHAAWTTLKRAEIDLQQVTWSRIHPNNIVYMIRIFGQWATEANDRGELYDIRRVLRNQVSIATGIQHPVALLMDAALTGRLEAETCRLLLVTADARANAVSAEQRERLDSCSLVSQLEVLWHLHDYQGMKHVLSSYWPSDINDECYKLERLAEIESSLKDLDKAERLYLTALNACSEARIRLNHINSIIGGYIWTLLQRGKLQKALEEFQRALRRYEEQAMKQPSLTSRRLNMDWFRWRIEQVRSSLRTICPDELDSVVAKLDAITLAL